MDRDQRSRQQKSRGGSFTRPAQKRSLSSRMGLQKQRPQTTASRRPAPNPNPQPQRRQTPPAQQYRHATQQLNPQKAGYTPGAPRRQRRAGRTASAPQPAPCTGRSGRFGGTGAGCDCFDQSVVQGHILQGGNFRPDHTGRYRHLYGR